MNTYHLYDLLTGLFLINIIQCPAEHLDEMVPEGCGCILGHYNMLYEKVDLETGEVIPNQPASPGDNYTWDTDTNRWIYVVPLQECKATKSKEINDRCTLELASIISAYPHDEVESWSKQETEARAYSADNTVVTPLLSALSTARGITLQDLVTRVLAKANIFAQVSGQIIGKRQKLQDQIDVSQTNEEVEAISWATE